MPARTNVAARRFLYVVIVLCAWNAVLRPSLDVPVTPYYVLQPFICAWLLLRDARFLRWLGWFALIAFYGLVLGVAYGVPLSMQFAQLLKYVQLLTFFGMLSWLHKVDPAARQKLIRIIALLAALVFAIAAMQSLTGFEFPTVVNDESALWLNAYFYTPNDLGLFLGAVVALLLASPLPLSAKLAGIAAITVLNLRNDAKAILLATAIMLATSILLAACARTRTRPIVGIAILLIAVPIGVLALSDTVFESGETQFDFLQLLVDPFERIFHLEPYELGGSIFDRTDALIYAIQALRSMAWLGLGPAGSVYALSLPNYELLTAKSLHNAAAELLVEFGPVMLLLAAMLLRPVLRSLFDAQPSPLDQARILLIVAVPMLSVSQSSGYISNYAFWLVAFLLWFSGPAARKRHAPRKRRVGRLPAPHHLAVS